MKFGNIVVFSFRAIEDAISKMEKTHAKHIHYYDPHGGDDNKRFVHQVIFVLGFSVRPYPLSVGANCNQNIHSNVTLGTNGGLFGVKRPELESKPTQC